MDNYKFESLTMDEKQIEHIKNFLTTNPYVLEWHIDSLLNGILISIRSIKLTGLELSTALYEQGCVVERLYEE